ncbi:N-acetyltransferase [Bombiscardovia apis]|uniref:N-acetyltransferase n=1 Tax=Bombiscardovia apis TaxID=2932182 RepID=A0ABM8BBP3_9BIFI|nr:GNAT family N-acetyltransferase [Bombiscardovia apis]BDR54322.1 N-acetyltransferase [Bombiscardovia apis]
MQVTVRYDALTPELYASVRTTAHFPEYDPADVRAALDGSFCSVVVYADGLPAGIGRVVADGRIAFFIKDLVVLPQYRGQRIGSAILDALIERISRSCCDHAYVGLLSASGKEGFYERHGFTRRPSDDMGSGMIRFLDHTEPGAASADSLPPCQQGCADQPEPAAIISVQES